jgi:hypothetical protein
MNETQQPAVAGPVEPTVRPSTLAAFLEAVNGRRGDLDAWLECNNEAEVRAHVLALVKAEREEWTKALDAEMVACHLGVFNAEDDPRAAIAKLLAWHQDVALDPAVSSRAQELILKEREACAKVCEDESRRAKWNWDNDISGNKPFWNGGEQLASSCAAAIRARGQE